MNILKKIITKSQIGEFAVNLEMVILNGPIYALAT